MAVLSAAQMSFDLIPWGSWWISQSTVKAADEDLVLIEKGIKLLFNVVIKGHPPPQKKKKAY